MRLSCRLPALLLALSVACAGCSFFGAKRPGPEHEVQRRAAGSAGPDVVVLNVAVVERPAGDRFLDHEVWESGDEQRVELELKPRLEANGLRVCQFGLLPDRLQSLLASPRWCPAPHSYRCEPDKPTPLQVGPVRATYSFAVPDRESEPRPFSFEQARCEFAVQPSLEEDDRIRLRFTPRVRHGKPRREALAVRDPDGQRHWAIESVEPAEELTELRFELTVAAGECVAVGAWYDREGTFGHACFVPPGEKVQYLLLLHATRVSDETARASATAPLAPQARGSSR
jgi:hypothetical protein